MSEGVHFPVRGLLLVFFFALLYPPPTPLRRLSLRTRCELQFGIKPLLSSSADEALAGPLARCDRQRRWMGGREGLAF